MYVTFLAAWWRSVYTCFSGPQDLNEIFYLPVMVLMMDIQFILELIFWRSADRASQYIYLSI